MNSLGHSQLVWQYWAGIWMCLRKSKKSWENLSWWSQRVTASYSLRVSYGPWERIPALSSANVFQTQLEMLPRRCTEAWGSPELSECAALPSQTQPGSKECSKEMAPSSCQRDLCQGPKPSRHMGTGKPSDTSPLKCCSVRRHRTITEVLQHTPSSSNTGVIKCWLPWERLTQPKTLALTLTKPLLFFLTPRNQGISLPLTTTALRFCSGCFFPRNTTKPMGSAYHELPWEKKKKKLNHLWFSHCTHFNHMHLFKHCSEIQIIPETRKWGKKPAVLLRMRTRKLVFAWVIQQLLCM